MRKNIHPPYQDILFVDTATGHKFVCGSTLQPEETDTFEGKEYPVYRVPISSASHPFFTGSQQFVDSEGRVDKFKKRYSKKPLVKKAESKTAIEKIKEKKAKPAPKKKEAEAKKEPAKKAAPKKPAAKKEAAPKKAPAKKPAAKKAPKKPKE